MQWIKVFTDIFANPKIKILLKERDGDTFFRVWIQLLTIAGQCMQEGKLMISENNPMTVHELATIIHKTDAKMENILNKLIHLEMLIYQENTYIIKNWYKYQSIDKYEKILEQNRARQKRFRDKKKEESNVTQTSSNVEEENIAEKNKIENNRLEDDIKAGENGSGFKKLISDIVLDTDNKMHKQCKFCGKLLHINDYTALYVNIVYKDIATAYERCTCNEASKIWQQYDEYIEKDKIRKIDLSKINKLFKNNNLGKRQLNSTFENYKITNKNKNAYENVKKYVDKLIKGTTNKGLFITGAYGVGKTYLASCIANEIIKNGKSVIFGTLIQLLDFIRDSYSDSEVSDKDYLNLYSSVDLLVIDDLGKEKPTEWVLEKLFLIVNNRYNNYLPIVITTNYNRNQLRERLCINKNYSIVDSIISRLYEMCGGIEIKDDDHRMSDSLIRESPQNS